MSRPPAIRAARPSSESSDSSTPDSAAATASAVLNVDVWLAGPTLWLGWLPACPATVVVPQPSSVAAAPPARLASE